MAAERADKAAVRQLWVEAVRRRKADTPAGVPFYLTLPGEGRDIEVLIAAGLVGRTENGQIAEADASRVIAIEKDSRAVLSLKKKFPGLKVITGDLADMLQGYSPFSWPGTSNRPPYRATVINLDFNQAFAHGKSDFNAIAIVQKIAALHTAPPDNTDWTLLLTLQGEVNWPADVQLDARKMVGAWSQDSSAYEIGCRARLLGQALLDACVDTANHQVALHQLSRPAQQQFLMAFVPAIITYRLFSDGWRVRTAVNLRYGGVDGAAPMVTFVLDVEYDGVTSAGLVAALRASLDTVAADPRALLSDGSSASCAPEHP